MSFAKFLRIPFIQNTSGLLLLSEFMVYNSLKSEQLALDFGWAVNFFLTLN